jgi:AcrR family transcriptional regulator
MDKGDRYNGIILSSIDVFAGTNYEKATTALLAKEAGIAEGTLYRYFPSKKELFLECFRYIEGLLIERYQRIYEETKDQPLEYVKRVALSYQEFVRENPNVRKFIAFLLNNTYDEEFYNEQYLHDRAHAGRGHGEGGIEQQYQSPRGGMAFRGRIFHPHPDVRGGGR